MTKSGKTEIARIALAFREGMSERPASLQGLIDLFDSVPQDLQVDALIVLVTDAIDKAVAAETRRCAALARERGVPSNGDTPTYRVCRKLADELVKSAGLTDEALEGGA